MDFLQCSANSRVTVQSSCYWYTIQTPQDLSTVKSSGLPNDNDPAIIEDSYSVPVARGSPTHAKRTSSQNLDLGSKRPRHCQGYGAKRPAEPTLGDPFFSPEAKPFRGSPRVFHQSPRSFPDPAKSFQLQKKQRTNLNYMQLDSSPAPFPQYDSHKDPFLETPDAFQGGFQSGKCLVSRFKKEEDFSADWSGLPDSSDMKHFFSGSSSNYAVNPFFELPASDPEYVSSFNVPDFPALDTMPRFEVLDDTPTPPMPHSAPLMVQAPAACEQVDQSYLMLEKLHSDQVNVQRHPHHPNMPNHCNTQDHSNIPNHSTQPHINVQPHMDTHTNTHIDTHPGTHPGTHTHTHTHTQTNASHAETGRPKSSQKKNHQKPRPNAAASWANTLSGLKDVTNCSFPSFESSAQKTDDDKMLKRFTGTVPNPQITTQKNSKTRAHKCVICNKVFKRPSSYRIHYTIHSGEKDFSCYKCGKKFNVKSNLTRHEKLHVKSESTTQKENHDPRYGSA
ncbi:hypothetical protein JCM33374_g6618 [Metschnikowia sp. JCM 33374]|nr:hypothetical protein JCM33374_g6618 [Metschnikowia sp. JCM 33374]